MAFLLLSSQPQNCEAYRSPRQNFSVTFKTVWRNMSNQSANPAVNWTAYTLRVSAASYFER